MLPDCYGMLADDWTNLLRNGRNVNSTCLNYKDLYKVHCTMSKGSVTFNDIVTLKRCSETIIK